MARGQLTEASDDLYEAEAALRRASLPLADVLLVEARLAYRRNDLPLVAATRTLEDPESHPTPVHRAQVYLLRGEVACDTGNAAAAAEELSHLSQLTAAAGSPPIKAGVAHLNGRLHTLKNQPAAAGESFDQEAKLQQQSHRYPEMSIALLHAGEAYRKAAQPDLAGDRFYRAAASLVAQEKTGTALPALESASMSARTAGNQRLLQLVVALRAEIQQTRGSQRGRIHATSQPTTAHLEKPNDNR